MQWSVALTALCCLVVARISRKVLSFPGVTDIHLLFAIFTIAGVSIQFGATHEAVNAKARSDGLPQNWMPFWLSWIAHFVSWFFIFNYAAVLGREDNARPGVVAIVSVMVSRIYARCKNVSDLVIPHIF